MSSSIFDDLNAVLSGGGRRDKEIKSRATQCLEAAAVIAPTIQNMDWNDIADRIEAINSVFVADSGTDDVLGVQS